MIEKDEKSGDVQKPRDTFRDEMERLVHGQHSDPFHFLGPHWIGERGQRSLAIRVFRPAAVEV